MNTLRNMKNAAVRLWKDEQGAESMEKLLIAAALVLPLLAVLIFFGGEIKAWLSDSWEDVQDDAEGLGDGF